MNENTIPQKILAIVPAGGIGSRMNSDQPKQFMSIHGKPILIITLETLINTGLFEKIIIATIDVEQTKELIQKFLGVHENSLMVCNGGKTRQESVYKALQEADKSAIESDFTLVHDAVRSLVSPEIISQVIDKAIETNAATAARQVTDTLKLAYKKDSDYIIEKNISRENIWAMQTPQVFKTSLLKEAHKKAHAENFQGTDCCALVERLGQEVYLVESPLSNIKITTQEDIKVAERFLLS